MTAITFVNHPYGSPVIGWESEIEALNAEAAIAFYDRFYTPNNAVLIVAGDVDPADVKELAKATYGKVARRAEPGDRIRPVEPPLSGERRIAVTDPRVRQESISHTWIVPSQTTGQGRTPEALDILAYILGEGPSSRLYKKLVLETETAISTGAYYQGSALNHGRFYVYVSPRPGHSLEEVEDLAAQELRRILESGVTDEEVERAKHSMIASSIYAQDSQSGLARLFGSALTTGQSVENVQTWPSQVQAVTKDDVLEAARTYLSGIPVTGELRIPQPDQEASTPDKSGKES
jgi:zinc protease